MRVLLSGASGFIGRHLGPGLALEHELVAMTRRPDDYDGPGTPIAGDTGDPAALRAAMDGCEAAYYLIHGLDRAGDFAEQDAQAARAFGTAAADAGVGQIIYLGGLGREGDDLSDHLQSRQEVEGRLGQSGVPVTALRAALVIGHGSASFELLRQVVANLPLLVIPPDAGKTLVQPIAIEDTVRYLLGVLGNKAAFNAVYEIGGPDVLTYEDLLHLMRKKLHKRGPAFKVPYLPGLAATLGVNAVTNVDPRLGVTLLDSLGNDVVVNDDKITRLLPGPLMSVSAMLDSALAESNVAGG